MHRPGVRPGGLFDDTRRQPVQPGGVEVRMRRTKRMAAADMAAEQADLVDSLVGAAALQLRRSVG